MYSRVVITFLTCESREDLRTTLETYWFDCERKLKPRKEGFARDQQQCIVVRQETFPRGETRSRDVDRSIARRPAQDAEKLLAVVFLLVSPIDTTESKRARINEDIRATREHSHSYPETEGRANARTAI